MTREHPESDGINAHLGARVIVTAGESHPSQDDSLSRRDRESAIEHAAFSVHLAVADFVIAARLAQSSESAMAIATMIEPLLLALHAAQDSAVGRSQVLRQRGR